MCFNQPKPPRPPKPPPLPPAPVAPAKPAPPAPAPKPAQPAGSQPDLRVGGMRKASTGSSRRVSSSTLRNTLNIGNNTGGLNS
jgi:hypothetical protein